MRRELWHCCRNIKRYNRYHNHWAGLKQSLEAELKAGAEAKEKLANLEAGKKAGSLSDHTLVVHVSSSSLLHLPCILNHLWDSGAGTYQMQFSYPILLTSFIFCKTPSRDPKSMAASRLFCCMHIRASVSSLPLPLIGDLDAMKD